MKTKRILRSAVLAIGLFIFQSGNGQVSTTNNFPFAPGTDYVGWDGNTNVPLMVRHNNNQRIEWYTDSLLRMLLTPTLPNQNWAWWQARGELGL